MGTAMRITAHSIRRLANVWREERLICRFIGFIGTVTWLAWFARSIESIQTVSTISKGRLSNRVAAGEHSTLNYRL